MKSAALTQWKGLNRGLIIFIPIISARTPTTINLGQAIASRVKMGFFEYHADVSFLNFEIKETAARRYDIRGKAFYDNILNGISLPVVLTFDTTLLIHPPSVGQYLLRFYKNQHLVQVDTVQVN